MRIANSFSVGRSLAAVLWLSAAAMVAEAEEPVPGMLTTVPGYSVELAAGPPLVAHPLMATFDERGRLYVAASAGENLQRRELEEQLPNFVQRLEDIDGDGTFDRSTVFADRMTFPQGCLWWRGALYVASSGAIWKLVDADDDGVAETRIKLVGDFGYIGNAADIHGPFAGPDGRLYWCDGRHGHEIQDQAGQLVSRGKAARMFSCREDGTDVRTYCLGGMDNPVEILFTPRGDMFGTVNLMYSHPRGDCLVNWQWEGVYPREDFSESLGAEFLRTGPLLPEVQNFGHVALSGLCQNHSAGSVAQSEKTSLLITQFNTHRLVEVTLQEQGANWSVVDSRDFAVSGNPDFHPTDVLEDADGSVLLIDTGGWFRIGCPQSQVAKSHVLGGIYRLRPTSGVAPKDARGHQLDWQTSDLNILAARLQDTRPAVRERAATQLADQLRREWNEPVVAELSSAVSQQPVERRQAWIRLLADIDRPAARAAIVPLVQDPDTEVRRTAIRSLLYAPPDEFSGNNALHSALFAEIQQGSPAASRTALNTATWLYSQRADFVLSLLKSLPPIRDDANWRHAAVLAFVRSDAREQLNAALFSAAEPIRLLVADALAELRRPRTAAADQVWLEIPPAGLGQPLTEADKTHLQQLADTLPAGELQRGQLLFASDRAGCAKCHRIGNQGGQVGPDLSTIGKSRAAVDLLESILYPSASYARGFAPYLVSTEAGLTYSGIVLGESSTHLRLGLSPTEAVSIANGDIDQIRPAEVSIMPTDVARQLNQNELADLISYLLSLK